MARVNDFVCDVCGRSILAMDLPFVVYVASGIPGRSRDVYFPPGALPAGVEALNLLPEPRVEYCLEDWVKTHLVHPDEVKRMLDLALAEHRELNAPRTVQEIEYKRDRILELARDNYRAAVERSARELGLLAPATPA